MNEMVERVAKAIAFAEGARIVGPGQSRASREFGWNGDGAHFQKFVDAHWKEFTNTAEIATEAMRGMVPVVRENGEVVHELRGAPADIWSTMMGAALGPLPVYSTKPVE